MGAVGYLHEVALERFGAQLPQLEIYFAGPPAMALAVQRMLVECEFVSDRRSAGGSRFPRQGCIDGESMRAYY